MVCENCGSIHDGNYGSGRFCCEKCARSFSTKFNREETNRKVSKTLGGKCYKPKEKYCLYCGDKLSSTAKKFCNNNSCMHEYAYLLNVNSWLLNVYDFKDVMKCPEFIRDYLLDKYNNSCSLCGWKEVNPLLKRPILEIEHIDGNCMDHSYKNVTLLCPNCHTLTPTYRGLNINNPKRDKRITYGGRSFKK